MTVVCSGCGAAGEGNFCESCGTSLRSSPCAQCGATAPTGSKFCTQCGTPLGAGKGRTRTIPGAGGANLGWIVAGLLMVGLILSVAIPAVNRPSPPPAGGAGGPSALPTGGLVDLSSMTPREAADRLFNRVMRSAESGDSTDAQAFLPMSIAAYERARPLDADGMFHLSLLQRTALQLEEAAATAIAALAESPDHLLNLSAAAEALVQAGDSAGAREHYGHFLEVYDTEMALQRQEYLDHQVIIPNMRLSAQDLMGGQG